MSGDAASMVVVLVMTVVVNVVKGAKSSVPSVFQHGTLPHIKPSSPSPSVTYTIFLNTLLNVYFSSETFSIVLALSDMYVSLQRVNTARCKKKRLHNTTSYTNKSLQCFDKSDCRLSRRKYSYLS